MITVVDSTVFNTDAVAIVNAVNTVGFMGAGLALEFALRYPEMEQDYVKKCKEKKLSVGSVDYYQDKEKIIVNFPTKAHFKYPSRIQWIEAGLRDFVRTYKDFGINSVAFPKLGCSNGGLDWKEVKQLMEKYLSQIEADVYICTDSLKQAEGKEKIMVDKFNSCNMATLSNKIRLSDKQKIALNSAKPIDRFWKIGELDGIGSKTYQALFKHFYSDDKCEQLSLFD